MEVQFYNASVEDFIAMLEESVGNRTVRMPESLERFGNKLSFPDSRALGGGLFELRIHGARNIRLFYCFFGGSAVILHGFIKKTQKTPQRELSVALKRKRSLTKL